MRTKHRAASRIIVRPAQGALLLFSIIFFLPGARAEQLTIERLYEDPALNGKTTAGLQFSPDGRRVTFLRGKESDYLQQDLWEYDIASEETRMLVDSRALYAADETLSPEEQARRERKRISGRGIVEYKWSHDGQSIVFPVNGDVYYYDLRLPEDKATRRLTDTAESETDIQISPMGNFVSYIREQDLFVYDLATSRERALTSNGDGPIKNGMAEFVVQEELGRYTGYWWSKDDKYIAFTRVDESPVGIEQRYEIDAESFRVFDQRYPRTGTPNATYKIGVMELATQKTQWMNLPENRDTYLARVNWLNNNREIALQVLDRDQHQLSLTFYDAQSGKGRDILEEKNPTWVNIHDDLRFLDDESGFLWTSERSGYRHIYLYSMNGTLQRPLTSGTWVVSSVKGVNASTGTVYFDGFAKNTIEKHLYSVALTSNPPENLKQITSAEGWHGVTMDDNASGYIDHFSNPSTPPQVSLHQEHGRRITWLEENRLDETHPYFSYLDSHAVPEFGQLAAEDGQALDYAILKPVGFDESKTYPVVFTPYGGPHGHSVRKSWGAGWHQILSQNGYIVFTLDNRGSADRGKRFEDPIYLKMGDVEIQDQLVGAEYLRSLSYVDDNRIGIYGWSYGGYMVLMSMFKHPEVFSAGVAVAPVTQWDLYDTAYTERYLGRPQNNAEGYLASSVYPYVDNLEGSLLVIHGMADDNVLFLNSTKLFKALQERDIPFEMMTYPGSKHGIRGKQNRKHLFKTTLEFFNRTLAGE